MARCLTVWMAALVACADGAAVDPVIACRDAARAHRPEALASCAATFAQTADPTAGGGLARALLDRGTAAQIEALAAEVGDRPGGAEAWAALGARRRADGDPDAATAAFRRAYDHRGADERGRALDAFALAKLSDEREDEREAIQLAATAYEGLRRVDDAEARAYVLVGIASMMYEMGALQATESLIAEAAPVVRRDSFVWGNFRHMQALIDRARGRTKLARRGFADAAAWFADRHYVDLERRARLSLVMLALAGGDRDAAAAALADVPSARGANEQMHRAYVAALVAYERGDLAEVVATEIPKSNFEGGMLALRGRALARLGRDREAEETLLKAIGTFEDDRDAVAFDALKSWTLDNPWKRSAFEDLFLLYAERGRTVDAFDIVQRATARSVLDVLSSPARSGPVARELERAGARQEAVRALTNALRTSAATSLPHGDALLKRLGDRRVLTYFRARDELWLIDSVGAAVHLLRIGRVEELRATADDWVAHPDRLDLADTLGARLLPPAVSVAAGERLYVAVDQPIREIPFAALRRDGRFLVEGNLIAYVPSAAVLATLDTLSPRTGAPVVVGDPTNDLPSARREARDVAAALAIEPKIGPAATRNAIFAGSGAAVLHVAAHSEATAAGPELVLADGRVGAGEILDRGVAAEVVVLASCASADPTNRAELGALASAFLAAGTRNVVASRWAVGDEVALEFSRAFYASDGARDPAAATAAAQRSLIHQGVPLASWSTFVVYGGRLELTAGGRR